MNSLLCVQGSIQYISSMVAIRYKEEQDHRKRNIFIVFYDLSLLNEDSDNIYKVLLKKSLLFNVSKCFYINNKEMKNLRWSFKSIAKKKVKKLLGNIDFDEVYTAGYFGYGNKLLVETYKDAFHVQYGDSMGYIGNEKLNTIKKIPIKQIWMYSKMLLKESLFDFNKNEYVFDQTVLILPISFNNADKTIKQLSIPSKKIVLNVINKCSAGLANKDWNFTERKYCVLLTSNLSQSGLVTKSNEVKLYETIINNIPVEYYVLVKLHPRMNKTFFYELKNIKRNRIILLDDFYLSKEPIEILLNILKSASFVVPVYSTAQVNLRYLYDTDIELALTDELVDIYWNKEYIQIAKKGISTNRIVMEKLRNWDGNSILYKA